ncbi:Predicted exporter [Arboricoccus pini]|uniref:Predicted exporter n=1 Tax=Arboricoccus pini TaxID=1963835 RepID=A0A212R4J2_9PROT|nr:MMPL family transporter [Arboricoccus pini]SNB66788.1 Predicted exporter [Arboricoccus pini]
MSIRRQAFQVGLVLLTLAVLSLLLVGRVVQIRTDMAAFLPPGGTAAQRFLIEQLREGPAATLILVGLEGAPEAELAGLSRTMAGDLAADPHFKLVANGATGLDGSEQTFLFRYRYLLSARTSSGAFESSSLHGDLTRLLGELSGAGGMMAARFGLSDPIGAFPYLLKAWLGSSQITLKEGVWFAPDAAGRPPRALLLLRTTGQGLDIEGQRQAKERIEAAFVASHSQARLLLSGPGIFAVASADTIKGDAEFVSILSSLLVVLFLYWRHRSFLVLGAVAVTLGTGALAAALAVQAAFGFVHGITLGFGMTMLGVTADYPLLVIGQRRLEESLLDAARRLWPTLAQAVGAALLGLVVMLMSSFAGLAQLGLFSVVGVTSAGLMTRFVLPHLTSAIHVRDQSAAPFWLRLADRLRTYRFWLALPLLVTILCLIVKGGVHFTTNLADLSPVPKAEQNLDEEMRHQIGAPDVRYLVAIQGGSEEEILEAAERLEPTLDQLVSEGAMGSFELPSRYLPSTATQLWRQRALPDPTRLAASLEAAMAGLPFKPTAFDGFKADVEASRALPPLTLKVFTSPALQARLESLLVIDGHANHGLATLNDVQDPARIARTLNALDDPHLILIDTKGETESLVGDYLGEALRWLALGGFLMLLMLAAIQRDHRTVLRVAGPALGAALVALAVPDLLGKAPNLFNLASLLLMVGVSIDYGLFLNRRNAGGRAAKARPSPKEAALALGSVLNCAAATLLTFGLLIFCRNPVLSGIGLTVVTGVATALILAIALSPRPADPETLA